MVSVAIIAPFGILLGVPMPSGSASATAPPARHPWAWGVNGIVSVLASVLGVVVAIFYGFAVASPWPPRCALRSATSSLVAGAAAPEP